MTVPPDVLEQLPDNSHVVRIAYANVDEEQGEVLFNFPACFQQSAVMLSDESLECQPDLEMLLIPVEQPLDETALSSVRQWIDESEGAKASQSLLMTLQFVQVFWTGNRVAIIAKSSRLETVRNAVLEVTRHVNDLLNIEQQLGERWPQFEADVPKAFDFDVQASREREELRKRFQEIYLLRARLAKTTPYLLTPHVYPPTLASQVGERLRERLRVEDRVEFVSDQLEVFEDVYELCGQRANDFLHAKSNNTLEWIIIVLLFFELLVTAFDYLTAAGS